MRRRLAVALAVAVLLHGAGSCRKSVRAQEPESCESPTPEGMRALADALELDDDQLGWLLERVAAGTLRTPEDLDTMPGVGAALRDVLTASICWDAGWAHRVLAGGRTVDGGFRREVRASIEHRGWEAAGRVRDDPGSRTVRGGVDWTRGDWRLVAGTLSGRRGLGLLGGASGGFGSGVSLRPARGGWRPSQAVDPEHPLGVHLDYARGAITAGAGRLRGRIRTRDGAIESTSWLVADGRWTRGPVFVGVCGVGRWGWSLVAGGPAGPGTWAVEWARAGSGTAQAGAWSFRSAGCSARAGVVRAGRGYRVPTLTRWARARNEDRVLLEVEARWQRARSRFLRVRLEAERDPDADPGAWGRQKSTRELEAGERVQGGWWAGLLWRVASQAPLARDPEAETGQVFRSDLERRGRPWRALLRWEERREAGGDLRTLLIRLGRGRDRAWEIRAAVVRSRGQAPAGSWYRRRAGGQFGWDGLEPGTWLGGWGRFTTGACRLEVSADRRASGWDVAAAVVISSG